MVSAVLLDTRRGYQQVPVVTVTFLAGSRLIASFVFENWFYFRFFRTVSAISINALPAA